LSGDLKYAINKRGTWVIETVDTGGSPSLVLDSEGKAHISYNDIYTAFRYSFSDDVGDCIFLTGITVRIFTIQIN
jgi:hypothetical protein